MPKAASIVFGAFFTVLTAWCLGRLVLRRVRTPLYKQEFHLLAFAIGAALLSFTILMLGFVRLLYDVTFWAIGAAALLAAWKWGAKAPTFSVKFPRWFWLLYVPFAVIYIIVAMSPEMSPDGSGYHLGVVGTYYRAHGLVRITTLMYANLSMGIEMLFLMAYAFGRHSTAALLHCAFLLSLPLLMVCWGRRNGFTAAAAVAGIFVFCSPVFGVDGTSAYIDIALVFIIFSVFHLLEIWRDSHEAALIPVAGLLAGFCYAAKYTAFLAVPWGAWILFRNLRRQRVAWLKPVAVFGVCAMVMILPWVIRDIAWYDNPVSPFFNRWFPNPYIHVSFEQDYSEGMRDYGVTDRRQLPLEVTLRGELLCGLLGPLFLLSPLALFALRTVEGRRLLGAGLVFLIPYALNFGTRFLIPAAPFVAMALAMVLMRWQWLAVALAAAHAVASIPPVIPMYSAREAWRIARIPLRQALRIASEDSWLGYKSPSYRLARMIEWLTPPGSVIYTMSPFSESYTTREVWSSFQSATAEHLRDCLWMPLMTDWQPNRRSDFNFPPRTLRRIRLVQSGSGGRDVWSMQELRVFSGDKELARAPEWRLTASPFPWDIQYAFDNSPVTRWRAWEWLRSGMWVQVDFGKTETISRVSLEQSTDQWGQKVHLEGDTGDGQWVKIGGEPTWSDMIPPLGLRRMAMEEVKRFGVTHLVTQGGDFWYDDYENAAELWGLERIGQVDDSRLYRLR